MIPVSPFTLPAPANTNKGIVACFVCWTICSAVYENSNLLNSGAGYAQLVFIWLFGVFNDIGFSGLLVAYALEVLPFHLRAKGMMIMNITVQAILALSKFVYPLFKIHTAYANQDAAKQTSLPGTTSPITGTSCCSTQYASLPLPFQDLPSRI